jgi:hypothetical protein
LFEAFNARPHLGSGHRDVLDDGVAVHDVEELVIHRYALVRADKGCRVGRALWHGQRARGGLRRPRRSGGQGGGADPGTVRAAKVENLRAGRDVDEFVEQRGSSILKPGEYSSPDDDVEPTLDGHCRTIAHTTALADVPRDVPNDVR